MIWLNNEQLKEIGVSKGILHRNRSKWKFRSTGQRGRNGKMTEEVLLESLPQDLQVKYLRLQAAEVDSSLTTEEENPVADAAGAAETPAIQSERKLLAALLRYEPTTRGAFQAEAQRLADIIERYDAINPKRAKLAPGKHDFVPGVKQLCVEAKCTDPIVLRVEPKRARPRSPHTLDNWSKAYKADGLSAFLRKATEPQTTNDNRKAEISAEAIMWIEANWRTKPSPRALYRALQKEAAKHKWKIPAEGWVRRKHNNLPKLVSTLVFEGEKKFASKYGSYVPRTVEDLTALQILCGDHSVRDVTVMLPDGTLTRPWLTLWQCLRTSLLWGWHLDLTPSSNTIGLAYVNGVQNFGAQPLSRPDEGFYSYLYADQGKDYKSKLLTGQTLTFKQAARIEGGLNVLCTQRRVGFMEELGLKHIMARGYNAKEKAIERTHADISRWEQNTFKDEYCGKDTSSKPDSWARAWQKHQRLMKKFDGNLDWLRSESPFMSLNDYREALATGFINLYNLEPHTRTVLGGSKVVPMEEYQRLYTTKYEISDDALALLLMKADRKKIGKNGITMLNGQYLHQAMSQFKGEEIEVRHTDSDYTRIWAVLPNGDVVEAPNLVRSSILSPNKQTMEVVAKQRAHERKVVREFRFIQEGAWRGESVEDRVAAMINPTDAEPPEQQRQAVNARPTVHALNRFDRPQLASGRRSTVSTEQVESANVIEGMFGGPEAAAIKEEWED